MMNINDGKNEFIQVYREKDNFWIGNFNPAGVRILKSGKWPGFYKPEDGGVIYRREDGKVMEMDGRLVESKI